MKRLLVCVCVLPLMGAAPVKPNPQLGKTEAACRAGETGPALLITALGMRDAKGLLRAELYPPNDTDFLQDDAILVNQGKTFRRVDLNLTPSTEPTLCMRVPGPGRYALSLLHDRDRNLKFSLWSDGIGFSGNPKLRRAKPAASTAIITAGPGMTRISITMNYLHGFMQFGPINSK
ncbi:MAG: DUF2141 domain-containing protein [Sphingomonadaceae bacterium]